MKDAIQNNIIGYNNFKYIKIEYNVILSKEIKYKKLSKQHDTMWYKSSQYTKIKMQHDKKR